jgi:hypothetical protein
MMALLPPSSSRLLPSRSATRHADLPSDVRRAGEGHQRHAPVVDEAHRECGAGVDEPSGIWRAMRVPFQHPIADVLHGQRAQRRLRRGLPDRGIAADGGEEGVPRPDRHRKVEGGNHADHAERMPLLVHAVLRTLRVHGEAVQHARLPDGEIRDVDHLLHFAVALGLDLAVLQGHQTAESILVLRSSSPIRRTASPRFGAGTCASRPRPRRLPRHHVFVVLGVAPRTCASNLPWRD